MTVTFIEGIRIPKGQLSPTSTANRTSHCPTTKEEANTELYLNPWDARIYRLSN
jgi:hypothetical protein